MAVVLAIRHPNALASIVALQACAAGSLPGAQKGEDAFCGKRCASLRPTLDAIGFANPKDLAPFVRSKIGALALAHPPLGALFRWWQEVWQIKKIHDKLRDIVCKEEIL